MKKGSTRHIPESDMRSETVRVGISRFNKKGLGEWSPSTLDVPTGINVKRIK
jgi:hypothetical protein